MPATLLANWCSLYSLTTGSEDWELPLSWLQKYKARDAFGSNHGRCWNLEQKRKQWTCTHTYSPHALSRCSHKKALGMSVSAGPIQVWASRGWWMTTKKALSRESQRNQAFREMLTELQIADEAVPSSSVAQDSNGLWLYLGSLGFWTELGEGHCVFLMNWRIVYWSSGLWVQKWTTDYCLVNNLVTFQSRWAISMVKIEDSSLNILRAYTTSSAHNSWGQQGLVLKVK